MHLRNNSQGLKLKRKGVSLFMSYRNFISFVAFFFFIMGCLVVTHHNTHGQVPTPLASLPPLPTPPATLPPLPTPPATLPPLPTPPATLPPLPTPPATLPPLPTPPPIPTLSPPSATGIVFGFVSDLDEEPLTGVTVTITGTEFSDSEETDEDGFYAFENLAAGDYTLTYEKEGYQTQEEEISLEENEPPLDLGTIVMEEVVKAKISGYVYDIDFNPIEKVRLKIKGIKTQYNDSESSDAEGFFEFPDLDANTYVITAKKKGFRNAKKTVKLKEGEEREIEIEMKKSTKRVIKASAR